MTINSLSAFREGRAALRRIDYFIDNTLTAVVYCEEHTYLTLLAVSCRAVRGGPIADVLLFMLAPNSTRSPRYSTWYFLPGRCDIVMYHSLLARIYGPLSINIYRLEGCYDSEHSGTP